MEIISSARKLIFRPEEGAPIVQFPAEAVISPYGVDNLTPSIVVCNMTEDPFSYQGVSHEAGVVIVNQVPEDSALEALNLFTLGGQTNKALNAILSGLAKKGHADQYTCSLNFVEHKLRPAGPMVNEYTGIVQRNDRDLVPVWREGERFYVLHGSTPRLIQPSILLDTYRNVDGTKIDLQSIPQGKPEGTAA